MPPDARSTQTILRRRRGRKVASSTVVKNGNTHFSLASKPDPPKSQCSKSNSLQQLATSDSSASRPDPLDPAPDLASSDVGFDIDGDYLRTSSPDAEPVVLHPPKRVRVSSHSLFENPGEY